MTKLWGLDAPRRLEIQAPTEDLTRLTDEELHVRALAVAQSIRDERIPAKPGALPGTPRPTKRPEDGERSVCPR